MSNNCDTLSPRPVASTMQTSSISADDWLHLESGHGNGPSQPGQVESATEENSNEQASGVERNESFELRPWSRHSDGRPKLVQRSITTKKAVAHSLNIYKFIVEDHPQGYPRLASFINSDDNFLIARKYGFLRARVLLYRQDELSVLEKELLALDADDAEHRTIALHSRRFDEETVSDSVYSRKALIGKIEGKLKEYGKERCYNTSVSNTTTT